MNNNNNNNNNFNVESSKISPSLTNEKYKRHPSRRPFIKRRFAGKDDSVKIIPLGGVEEIGINCTAFEYRNEIIVIDAGLGFPENDQLGIDFLIPNIDYLKKNIRKIKGIFITHGHYDHIGALHLVLPRLKFPRLYAPPFAAEVIKGRLIEDDILKKVNLTVFKGHEEYNTGNFKISFFRVNHSTPDSFGVVIKTQAGTIVHTGDFKFDNSPPGYEEPADFQKIAKVGSEGVLALLSDSTNSFKKGFSTSEAEVTEILRDVVEHTTGRVIVATFSQLVTRISQLLEVAQDLGKTVAVSGRSLENTIKIAKKLGYIKVEDKLFMKLDKISKVVPMNKQMIFVTGHQGESMAALSRIARGEHKQVKIQEGDTVILSSSVIPGNDLLVQKMIDDLSQKGAKVFHKGIMDLHTGGHGYQEDQKLMINLIKPKYFIPVHGYQSFLAAHCETAQALGIKKENCLVAKRGEEILVSKNVIKRGAQHRSLPIIVSGSGVGDVGYSVIKERQQLAASGIIIVNIVIDRDRKIKTAPQVTTKGFIYEKAFQDLIQKMQDIAVNNLKLAAPNTTNDAIELKIESEIALLVTQQLQREPIIEAVISVV